MTRPGAQVSHLRNARSYRRSSGSAAGGAAAAGEAQAAGGSDPSGAPDLLPTTLRAGLGGKEIKEYRI